MLLELHIKNYTLIEELKLEFKSGLTVVTGETGSGKSILISALGLALGERATTSTVRHGSHLCSIEAKFISQNISDVLENWDLEPLKSGVINIRRELSSSGRSKAFVNDSQISIGTLKEIGALLVDLHGQDETRGLMERITRLELLDSFGGHFEIRDSYRAAFSGWRTATQKLEDLEAIATKPQSDVDYLQFQLNELMELELEDTNWSELEEEFSTLTNSTELAAGYNSTFESIDSLNLNEISKILESIAPYSKQAEELLSRFKSTVIELEDIAQESSMLSENVSFDPQRLMLIEEKLDGLKRSLHKHRVSTAGELEKLQSQISIQIESASNLEKDIAKAKDEVLSTKANMFVAGEALKKARQKCGRELLHIVNSELKPLKLPNVLINWEFSDLSTPDLYGIEDVDLLFSANLGSPKLPITQVASGGEKSRIMLSFKAALSSKIPVPTIVLDEIDTGVSGDIASRMAKSMRLMAKKQQVIAVTHLAQVAAMGDQHLEVSKETDYKSTYTKGVFLDEKQKTEAIAKIISGSVITEEALTQARILRSSNQ
tara:strand:+ start:739 stop:2382 length:1644 start_codon:yes stop_codon:yes gene_type:complete